MRTLSTHLKRRRIFFTTLLVLLLPLFASVFGSRPGTAQAPAKEEREVEDRIPKHLPIKVKIKKEKEEKVKDLKNDGWLGDLEVEVKNTGTKPIYYLSISLVFVDVRKDSGGEIGYEFQYGQAKLMDDINNRPGPDDVPIAPGETHVFKLHHDFVIGWDWYRNHVEKKPQPKKIAIILGGGLSFGDGTGYVTTGGVPFPVKKSSLDKERKASSAMTAARLGPSGSSSSTMLTANAIIPASFTPVNFYPPEPGATNGSKPTSQTCCSGPQCERMKRLTGAIASAQMRPRMTVIT